MGGRRGVRKALLVLVALLAAAVGVGLDRSSILESVELSSLDQRFEWRGERGPVREAVLVAIDEKTLDEVDGFPFPRRNYAKVLDAVRRDGARAIGIDVEFAEPSDSVEDDNALVEAIGLARGTVLAAGPSGENDVGERDVQVLGGQAFLNSIGATAGSYYVDVDSDGGYRRLPRSVEGLPSLSYRLALAAAPRSRELPDDPEILVDFAGPAGAIPTVSFVDVRNGRFPPGTFEDKIVMLGPTAPILQDLHETPFDNVMSGSEIQLSGALTWLAGAPLSVLDGWWTVLIAGLAGLFAPALTLLSSRRRITRTLPIMAGVAYIGVAQLAFEDGTVLPLVVPLVALGLGYPAALIIDVVSTAVERAQLYDLFGRFVGDKVLAEVVDQAADGVRLGGVERTCTVLFSDLRGFTGVSEHLTPQQVIDTVNAYLGEMSEAILEAGGTLMSYMGDGIYAVFGAPVDQPDHADRALDAAREMLTARLARFNLRARELGLGDPFQMGVGLHTGTVVAGNVGSVRRLEYTALGDTVNTCSRLEGMTKGSGYQLFLSDATRAALARDPADLVDLGPREVRGRDAPIHVWSVAAAAAAVAAPDPTPAAAEGATPAP